MCFWGSWLPFNITVTTTPDKYPGKNMLLKLLSDIRSELRANDIISDNPTPASQGTAVTVPSHKFLETPIHAQPFSTFHNTINPQHFQAGCRKRVKSPQAFTSADAMHVSDDSLFVSPIGSFVDSSDKRLAAFCDDHCESTCKS